MERKKNRFEKEVDRVIDYLESKQPDSDEYASAVSNLRTLREAASKTAGNRIAPEVWVPAMTSLIGILLMLNYEHLHVITSRAIGFIIRPRL